MCCVATDEGRLRPDPTAAVRSTDQVRGGPGGTQRAGRGGAQIHKGPSGSRVGVVD